MSDPDRAALDAYLDNKQLEEIEAYLKRGRQFAHVKTSDVEARWALSFKHWVACRLADQPDDTQEMDDLASEISLRGRPVPILLAKAEFEKLHKAQRARNRKMARDDLIEWDLRLGTTWQPF